MYIMYVNKHMHDINNVIQNYSNEGYFTLKFNLNKVSSFEICFSVKKKQTCMYMYRYFGCHYVFPVTVQENVKVRCQISTNYM